jgi:hypothetical protein
VQYTLQLNAVLQVYGGGVSFVVHPYVWSSNSFNGGSSASAGRTIVTGLSAVFLDCNFSGSIVSTRTISAPSRVFFKFLFALSLRLFYIHIHSIARLQVRAPEWQRLDLMYDVLNKHWERV